MRTWSVWLIFPFLSGCLALGYPSITRTPPVAVDAPDVHAFLVTEKSDSGGGVITGWLQHGREVRELPVAEATVKPQWDTHFSYYYLLFPYSGSSARNQEVLLYRPGYEPVELSSQAWWECLGSGQPVRVTWKRARDAQAQEKALARLAGAGGTSLDARSREFVVAEYGRLGRRLAPPGTPDAGPNREHLLAGSGQSGTRQVGYSEPAPK
jgi:hypothetical protein